MACPSDEIHPSPFTSPLLENYGSDDDDDDDDYVEKYLMGSLHLPRTVQRTYVGRRSGCSQPVLIVLLIFSAFFFVFFHLTSFIPQKPVPARFPWANNAVRDIGVYIRPKQYTAHLQPPDSLCQDKSPFLLVVVPSAINNTRERDIIRRTWGQWAGTNLTKILAIDQERESAQLASNSSSTNSISGSSNSNKTGNKAKGDTKKKPPNILTVHSLPEKSAKLVFLLGTLKGPEPVSAGVKEESRLFGDIVVEDFVDSYTNLTLKSVFMLKWVKNHCSGAQYVIKVDDDIFLNIPNLQRSLLNTTATPSPLLSGNIICGAKPIHNQWSKWYAPRYMFPQGKYPNYLSGTGYVMSTDLVPRLLDAALTTPYFHLEDVFLTGICAKKIGVRPTDNLGFSFIPRAVNACIYKEVIMGHEVSPVDVMRLWNMMNQPKLLAKCRPPKRSMIRGHYPVKCSWR